MSQSGTGICRHRNRFFTLTSIVLLALSRLSYAEAPPQSANGFSFSETVVAGGPNDFITVRHVRLNGSQREIGKKLGEIAKQRHGVVLPKPEPAILRARQEFYRRNYPMHLDRGAGVADAFGLPFPQTDSDTLMLWFNMEPPVACSTVFYPGAYTESGHVTLSRNYDFTTGTFAELLGGKPPVGVRRMNADAYVMEVYPDKGIPSLYVCAYDLLSGAMDGINAAGLTVALLADGEAARGTDRLMTVQPGLNQLELPRFLLETCSNVDEAKVALMAAKQYYLFIPAHFIIGDRSGQSFVWEYGPAHNREYVTEGGGKPQIVTNHSLYPYKSFRDFPRSDSVGSTYGRYIRMQNSIEKAAGKCTLADIKSTNDRVRALDSADSGHPERTLWHALYDCQDVTLDVDFYLGEPPSSGEPERRSGYLKFRLTK